MSLTVISLVQPGERCDALGWCVVCDRHPATTLVLADGQSPILGDDADGAEFGVCDYCAEVALPNAPRLIPAQRQPCVLDGVPSLVRLTP